MYQLSSRRNWVCKRPSGFSSEGTGFKCTYMPSYGSYPQAYIFEFKTDGAIHRVKS